MTEVTGDGIWFGASDGLYRVLVGGHQVGLYSRWRWARSCLRYHRPGVKFRRRRR